MRSDSRTPASSSITRMRGFGMAPSGGDRYHANSSFDADRQEAALIEVGIVHVEREHVAAMGGSCHATKLRSGFDSLTVDLQKDAVAFDAGVVRRPERIDARHQHAVEAARDVESLDGLPIEIANGKAKRVVGLGLLALLRSRSGAAV